MSNKDLQSNQQKYEESINEFLKENPIPRRSSEMFSYLSDFGSVVVHQPTGICGYSIPDVNEKLKRHYQKIIDQHLQFVHVKRIK